jgi:hypothetical protein
MRHPAASSRGSAATSPDGTAGAGPSHATWTTKGVTVIATRARSLKRERRAMIISRWPASTSRSRRWPSEKTKNSANHFPCGVSSADHKAKPGVARSMS